MKKKLAAAVSGGAVLMLVLSGCGGDDGDTKADDWAKKVCDKWQPEYKKIDAANAEMKRVASESSKPEEVQKTDSAAFQTMSEAFTGISSALRAAGDPGGKDGKATAEAAAKSFEDTAKGYTELKTKMDALDAKDQAKFAEGLLGLSGGLEKVAADEKAAKEKLKAGTLEKAMAKQKGCQATTPAPAQS
ncbi:small secreted protein [Streptomyces sp. NPDC002054]|uniref:small secreted protein n=1 Tax=Streptomyces sp. NPDC002054 TaxID=3154663 RepID=UPI003325D659